MPFVVWLIFQTMQWAAMLIAATVAVRVASVLVAAWRPPLPPPGRPRRDARWLLALVPMLALALALVHCQVGGFYSFTDPTGSTWTLDAHGWPLTEPRAVTDRFAGNGSLPAVYATALAVDMLCSLLLLIALRIAIDRFFAAWDSPRRWKALAREAAGWVAALGVVLAGERLAARPITLPGTELIVYTTLIYEPADVRAGMMLGLASAVFLLGLLSVRSVHTFSRLRDEGVI